MLILGTVGFGKLFYDKDDGQNSGHCLCTYCIWGIVICILCLTFVPSHDGTDSPPDANDVVVLLNNFKSKIIKVKVSLFCFGSDLFIVGK